MNAPHVSELELDVLEAIAAAGVRYLALPWGLWVDMRVRQKYITLYHHIRQCRKLEEVTLVELRRPKLSDVYKITEFKEIDGLTNGYGFDKWSARAEEERRKNSKWTVPRFRCVRVKYKDRLGEGWNNKSSLLQPTGYDVAREVQQTMDDDEIEEVEWEEEKDDECERSILALLQDSAMQNPVTKLEREDNKNAERDSEIFTFPAVDAHQLNEDHLPQIKLERLDY